MRRKRNRREILHRRRLGCMLLVLFVLFGVLFVHLDGKLRPIVQSYGVQAARRGAMLAVHNGVQQVLASQDTRYSDLVSVQRDDSGKVLSAEANVAAINLLKAEASASVTQQLNDHQIQKVNIPMGSIVGGSFFTGRGPFLPLDIHTGGSVITTLSGSFFDAGINQTCHQIYLNMTIYLTVLLPMERRMVELETEFLICETVLVGEVPESYTNIDFGNSEALSKIFGAND